MSDFISFGLFNAFYPHPEGLVPVKKQAELAWYKCGCEQEFRRKARESCRAHNEELDRFWTIATCGGCKQRLYYDHAPPEQIECPGEGKHPAILATKPTRRAS